jgi:DNA polymerase-3 subunit gamma/tau
MFENIIGQPGAVQALRHDLESGRLPPAIMLHGPQFSGKLSTALEIARILTCHRQAEWSCGCPSCRKQRLLVHPNTVLMGFRYFDLEIAAAADTLRRNPKTPSQYLFIRAVRKLTRRFDPLLWEGEETAIRGLQPTLAEIEERLDALLPEGQAVVGKGIESELDKLQELCAKAAGHLSADTIPIAQLRRAAAWLHMTALNTPASAGHGARKILILEDADRMQEASSSSLLKLLEEPPQDVHLMLLTTRPGALIPTVRSRLRPYLFVERDEEADGEVLKRIFHEEGGDYQSLREYFLYWNDVNPQMLRSLARRFIRSVLSEAGGHGEAESSETTETGSILEELLEAVSAGNRRNRKPRTLAQSFFEELPRQLRLLLREGGMSAFRLARWNRIIAEHQQTFKNLNQHPALALESLYYSLRTSE